MDYFFAQVEERENPQFKGRPVVVGADPKNGRGRGVVSTCNYIARKYGIKSALPISKAWRKCPEAVFLPVNHKLYKQVSEKIMKIVKNYSFNKRWEIVSLDEAYLDLSCLASFKKAKILAKKLKQEIFEKEKLTCTIGIGPNKVIAKMAAEKAKPNGLLVVTPSQVKKFLEPLDIQDLPGIGPKTAETLRIIGIDKIKQLKKLSKSKLKDMFGIMGKIIYERARGIDRSQVSSEKIIKSIGKDYTFEKDTRDPELIFKIFNKMIKKVHQSLLKNKVLFKTITVTCRFSDFETHRKSKTLKEFINDPEILKKEAKHLLLRFLVENQKLIRLIGLRVSNLK